MARPPAGLRAATRGSTLARVQTSAVADLLAAACGIDVEPVVVDTHGDRRTDAPIWAIGGQGVFVKEVQAAVLDGRADIAVHSAKDLPSSPAPGLVIAAIPVRGDPRDALVGGTLAGLPPGARIGTGSIRRRAQLAWLRPDLTFAGLRGNMETRLAKASGFDAIVVAAAALQRLGRSAERSEVLDPSLVVPQVGQGALAVECREDDVATRELLAAIDHGPSRRAVEAERAFLREVGGSCDLPVGAYATVSDDGATIRLEGLLATGDGRVVIRRRDTDTDSVALGRRVARYLLDEAGGADLLDVGVPATT
ncbi:MAG: hydroxymethylbilane synthase [Actinomycetota bacterium]|jgi:hydroxymethylbilane synthase|nr:hydroxymethylbilane synthase [Actinomycetota bacterium]